MWSESKILNSIGVKEIGKKLNNYRNNSVVSKNKMIQLLLDYNFNTSVS